MKRLDQIDERLCDLYDESAQSPASPENDLIYKLIPCIRELLDEVRSLATKDEGGK